MSSANNLLDVSREIKLDHDNVRDLFQRFKKATDIDQKSAIANTLVREMAIHSDAEEVSVYNRYPEFGLGNVAQHNREEHAEVKKLVSQANTVKVTDSNYDDIISKAVNAFLEHADEEESNQLKLILKALTAEENDKLAKDFLNARSMVPTRPHPWAPQTGGLAQQAAGMQGKLQDKVVETMQGRNFVDLKFSHPATQATIA